LEGSRVWKCLEFAGLWEFCRLHVYRTRESSIEPDFTAQVLPHHLLFHRRSGVQNWATVLGPVLTKDNTDQHRFCIRVMLCVDALLDYSELTPPDPKSCV
jgi:hypothetical protein